MYLFQPTRLIGTVLISVLSLLIFKLLSKRLLIFGRRRFVFLLILASFLSLCVNFVFKAYAIDFVGYQAVGVFVPGLLANNMSKQGGMITLLSLFTVSTFVFFTFRLVYII
jgi:poly-gamma-glutamate biosynthesis protein PgsC/CapC